MCGPVLHPQPLVCPGEADLEAEVEHPGLQPPDVPGHQPSLHTGPGRGGGQPPGVASRHLQRGHRGPQLELASSLGVVVVAVVAVVVVVVVVVAGLRVGVHHDGGCQHEAPVGELHVVAAQ